MGQASTCRILPQQPAAGVCLRVRGSLRHYLEDPDGKRHSLPEIPGQRKVAVDEYWTLGRRDGEWIACSIDSLKYGNRKGYLTEDFVGPSSVRG